MNEPKKEIKDIGKAVDIENLTFLNGVFLTWNAFNNILDKLNKYRNHINLSLNNII